MLETKGDLLASLARMRAELAPISEALAKRLDEIHASIATLEGEIPRPHVFGPRDYVRRETPPPTPAPIPFRAFAVPAGARHSISACPQLLFRGELLWVAARSAEWFDICDVRVGQCSQRVQLRSDLPGEAFAIDFEKLTLAEADSASRARAWPLDTAKPGIEITVDVVNRDPTHARDFAAVLWGVAFRS